MVFRLGLMKEPPSGPSSVGDLSAARASGPGLTLVPDTQVSLLPGLPPATGCPLSLLLCPPAAGGPGLVGGEGEAASQPGLSLQPGEVTTLGPQQPRLVAPRPLWSQESPAAGPRRAQSLVSDGGPFPFPSVQLSRGRVGAKERWPPEDVLGPGFEVATGRWVQSRGLAVSTVTPQSPGVGPPFSGRSSCPGAFLAQPCSPFCLQAPDFALRSQANPVRPTPHTASPQKVGERKQVGSGQDGPGVREQAPRSPGKWRE